MDAQRQPFPRGILLRCTVANITALWVARNNVLKPDGKFRGVAQEGLYRAMKHYGYDDLAILVSERGHYSLKKKQLMS